MNTKLGLNMTSMPSLDSRKSGLVFSYDLVFVS